MMRLCCAQLLRQDLCQLSSLLSDSRIISKSDGSNARDDSSCMDIAVSSIRVVINDLMKMLNDGTTTTTMVQSSNAVQADRSIPAVASLTWIDVSPSLQVTSHTPPLENVESLKILMHNTYCLWWMIVYCMDDGGDQHMMRDSNTSGHDSTVVGTAMGSSIVTIDQMRHYMQYIYNYHNTVLQDMILQRLRHAENR